VPSQEDDIRRRLAEFAARWGGYNGTERAEAQTFLNELLACYGVDRQAVGARFEERAGQGFMDLFWPGVCIVEMKRPSELTRLPTHRKQTLEYWQRSGTPRSPAPRYVVLCAFHRLEVWEPGAVYTEPRAVIDLVDLPDNLDALNFLAGRAPVFGGSGADLTREAVALVTDLYQRLRERRASDLVELRDFILQCVWAMFAEDLHILPSHLFTRVVQSLLDGSRSSADDLGQLFAYLATPGERPDHGLYLGTPYANGSLFTRPARVHLEVDELELLAQAAGEFNWRQVEPAIFGGLLQGALGKERQWALGAHYTAEADILKIVLPTVVEPWRERILACRTVADVTAAQNDLMHYVVLDPACGSGNFLYIAYRELRRIEAELRRRAADMRRSGGLREQQTLAVYFPLSNMKGIELDPFAVQLARVTLWMGHKLAVDELDLDETVLPLADLSGIRRGDALRLEWPRADAIIGNPPYHGTKFLRSELGDDYVDWLKSTFGAGVKDYAIYWFRKAHDHLEAGGRAGLVATNSIREGGNRSASLEYITDHDGVITNAVSNQPWPGEANVHVSIVNWLKDGEAGTRFVLDGVDVSGIAPTLRAGADSGLGTTLPTNAGRQFFGVVPGGEGFVLSGAEAASLLEAGGPSYRDVVRPFLVGADITKSPTLSPSRFIIDFHFNALEEAAHYPLALDRIRALVKPHRDTVKRKAYREKWWRLEEPIVAMRDALAPLSRFIACPAQAKRFYMIWCEPSWCPSNLTSVFAFDDDYSMGVLQSTIHTRWATDQSTTLETRPRYTTLSFMSFPWPQTIPSPHNEVATLARNLTEQRNAICLDRQIGLTQLYNEIEDGAYRDLKDVLVALDEAVASAYGWPSSVAHDRAESNRRLLELNREIAAGGLYYRPFD
jgi:N-6 DNA Methylase